MRVTDNVNVMIDELQPWQLAKNENRRDDLHEVCSAAMRAFHLLMILLKPTLPQMAAAAEEMLDFPLQWGDELQTLPAGHAIRPYQHLLKRMADKDIRALIQPEQDDSDSAAAKEDDSKKDSDTPTAVAVDDFAKIHLQIATVTAAEEVEGADKPFAAAVGRGGTGGGGRCLPESKSIMRRRTWSGGGWCICLT